MRIVILAVGAVKDPVIAAAVREYEVRAARYFALETIEVTPPSGRGRPAEVRQGEGKALLRRLPPELEPVALTRGGARLTSVQLADRLGEMIDYGLPGVVFLVGGPFGLDATVLERASWCLSLSSFTFPHELARLVLAEQLYRAGTIRRGEPYHKGE